MSRITVTLETNGHVVATARADVPETSDLLAALTVANAQFFGDSPRLAPCGGERHEHE